MSKLPMSKPAGKECSECTGIWLDSGELETVSKLEKTGLDKLFSVFK